MQKFIFILWIALLIPAIESIGQSVEKIDKEKLLEIISYENDTTYIINFWATWCSPCVKEIAYFENLHLDFGSQKLKVILVSLDFPNQLEKRVVPFLQEREITADVRLMTDLDYNSWINLVDPTWSGSIPATLIYNLQSRKFFEQEFSEEELLNIVKQIHN